MKIPRGPRFTFVAVLQIAALLACCGASTLYAQSETLLTTGIWYSGSTGFGGLFGLAGSETFFRIVVPAGQSKLVVETYGGEGDVDVYVRRGSHPTTLLYDASSESASTAESAVIDNPAAGTYYILLKGYGPGYLNVSARATYLGADALSGWRWAKSTEGNSSVIELRQGNAIAIDSAGNSYVAGQFSGTANFGPFRLVASAVAFPGILNAQAGFLAKYDANGQVQWAVTNVGATALAVAVGTGNSVYVTGDFSGTVRFSSSVSVTGRFAHNTFVAKYDASTGALIWALSRPGSGNNAGLAIACDPQTGVVNIGGYDTKPTSRIPGGAMVMRLISEDANGIVGTESVLSGTDVSYVTGLAFDADSNLYLTGAFRDTLLLSLLGAADLKSGKTQNDVPTIDAFFMKLNRRSSPTVAWAKAVQGSGTDDEGASIAVDPSGVAYGAGSIDSRHFLARFEPDGTGSLLFTSSPNAGLGYPTTVVADGRGGVYWSGCFSRTFSIGNATVQSSAATGGYVFNINAAKDVQWVLQRNDDIRAVAANSGGNIFLTGTFIDFTSFGSVQLSAPNVREAFVVRLDATVSPAILGQPVSTAVAPGQTATVSVNAGGGSTLTYQWQFNGTSIAGATNPTLSVANVQPANAGLYTAVVSGGASLTSNPAILGVSTSAKSIGAASEVGPNIVHANGNVYDQVLLQGPAATITADPGQVTRVSFIDLTNDIVQVEFSGAGTLSLVLDTPSGPAAPVNYNQTVSYVKGHVGIVITGANETTNVSVFSVGRVTAVNQALFKDSVTYDGLADLAFIAISSANGRFGGVRTANASYYASKGLSGIYAPGVQFSGPVYVGELSAFATATPALLFGSASDVRITGGDLSQPNSQPVKVSGITQLKFVDGSTSHGATLHAQSNKARFQQNGIDVTVQIVVNPGP